MSEISELEAAVLRGEAGIIDYICASLESAQSEAERLEADYWQSVKNAHRDGKKLVLFAGPVPTELLYASGCVPLYVDMLPLAVAKSGALLKKYINEVEAHVSPNLCSGTKCALGALRLGGIEVDAFIRAPISCPSSKSAYDDARLYLKVPYFEFDTPTRMSERNLQFMADSMFRAVDFLESVTGHRPELPEISALMEKSNRTRELFDACAAQREKKPCPMSSHMAELGRLMTVLGPTDGMAELLEDELKECGRREAEGFSPCSEGEKHRVFFMQCPLWCGGELRHWLEEKYGAVTVSDALGYEPGFRYEQAESMKQCYYELARGLFIPPIMHGGTQNAPVLLEASIKTVEACKPDVLLYLGDRWCRHTWAVSKMLTDTLQERFGLATFFTDADGIDPGYKDEKQLKALISEYMDAVVCGK